MAQGDQETVAELPDPLSPGPTPRSGAPTGLLPILLRFGAGSQPRGRMTNLMRVLTAAQELAALVRSGGAPLDDVEAALAVAQQVPGQASTFWDAVLKQLRSELRAAQPNAGVVARRTGRPPLDPEKGAQTSQERSSRYRHKRGESGDRRLTVWVGRDIQVMLDDLIGDGRSRDEVVNQAIAEAWRARQQPTDVAGEAGQ